MTATPETRYAKTTDGAYVAFQVAGDGPVDVLFVLGAGIHVEMAWEVPACARVFRRLASFSRLIMFDQRGSEPPIH